MSFLITLGFTAIVIFAIWLTLASLQLLFIEKVFNGSTFFGWFFFVVAILSWILVYYANPFTIVIGTKS